MTIEELSTTVARYLGEERTRSLIRQLRLDARISCNPKAEADFQLIRYAEHLLASAIGGASSRLVLSLLLRKRTVSTKAALKLSTMPTPPSITTAKSCRPRSNMCGRALPCSTGTCN